MCVMTFIIPPKKRKKKFLTAHPNVFKQDAHHFILWFQIARAFVGLKGLPSATYSERVSFYTFEYAMRSSSTLMERPQDVMQKRFVWLKRK